MHENPPTTNISEVTSKRQSSIPNTVSKYTATQISTISDINGCQIRFAASSFNSCQIHFAAPIPPPRPLLHSRCFKISTCHEIRLRAVLVRKPVREKSVTNFYVFFSWQVAFWHMISPFKLKPLKTYKTSSALKTLFAIYVTKTFVLNWCESFFSLVFNFRDSPLRDRHENEHTREKKLVSHTLRK